MHWIILVLLASLCWSITNHVEKFLLSRFFKSHGAGGFILTTLITYLIFLPAIFAYRPDVIHVTTHDMLLMLASGVMYTLGILAYLHAIERDEVSIAVPLFQTIPIFAYIFGYFLLGEQLTRNQIIGSLIIILAAGCTYH
jgi:drug/metabolite transporter (DMT)-like permease